VYTETSQQGTRENLRLTPNLPYLAALNDSLSGRIEVGHLKVGQAFAEELVQDRCALIIGFQPDLRLRVDLEEPSRYRAPFDFLSIN
jgi:hypothetical protein